LSTPSSYNKGVLPIKCNYDSSKSRWTGLENHILQQICSGGSWGGVLGTQPLPLILGRKEENERRKKSGRASKTSLIPYLLRGYFI